MTQLPRPHPPERVEAAYFPSGAVFVRLPGYSTPLMIPADIAHAVAEAIMRAVPPLTQPPPPPVPLLDVFQAGRA